MAARALRRGIDEVPVFKVHARHVYLLERAAAGFHATAVSSGTHVGDP